MLESWSVCTAAITKQCKVKLRLHHYEAEHVVRYISAHGSRKSFAFELGYVVGVCTVFGHKSFRSTQHDSTVRPRSDPNFEHVIKSFSSKALSRQYIFSSSVADIAWFSFNRFLVRSFHTLVGGGAIGDLRRSRSFHNHLRRLWIIKLSLRVRVRLIRRRHWFGFERVLL